MKDFVREYGRIAAIFAGAAFVLSFLVGLVSGNPFGTAFLRALLLGIVFGLLGVGFSFIIKKYLPELVGQTPSRAVASESREKHAVDIVLPDENPHGDGEPVQDVLSDSETPEEAMSGEEPAAEAEELPPAASMERAPEEIYDEEPAEVIEDSPGMEAMPEPEVSVQGSPGLDTLDTLPDIGDLDNISGAGTTISQDTRAAVPRPSSRPRRERPVDEMSEVVSEQDPESLAKAIRTVLKRDEKG